MRKKLTTKTARLKADIKTLVAQVSFLADTAEQERVHAEQEHERAEQEHAVSLVQEDRIRQLEAEVARKNAELEAKNAELTRMDSELEGMRNSVPQYGPQKRSRLAGFFAVAWVCTLLANTYLAITSQNMSSLVSALTVLILKDVFASGQYFCGCTNRNIFWDVSNGITACMDAVAFILLMALAGGWIAMTHTLFVYFAIVMCKSLIPESKTLAWGLSELLC